MNFQQYILSLYTEANGLVGQTAGGSVSSDRLKRAWKAKIHAETEEEERMIKHIIAVYQQRIKLHNAQDSKLTIYDERSGEPLIHRVS